MTCHLYSNTFLKVTLANSEGKPTFREFFILRNTTLNVHSMEIHTPYTILKFMPQKLLLRVIICWMISKIYEN